MRVTISYGPANSITKNVAHGTRLSEVITREVKAALGAGDNVQPLIQRRHVDMSYVVGSDIEVELETVANRKAGITVTVEFGPSNTLNKELPDNATVGTIRRDRSILTALGVTGNVKALIDRQEQPDDAPLEDGDIITLETVANTKAVA
jgi:hypothetical protein